MRDDQRTIANVGRKDDLILAYLDKVDQAWFGQLRAAARAAGAAPRDLLVRPFAG